jgi:hypothetical protein
MEIKMKKLKVIKTITNHPCGICSKTIGGTAVKREGCISCKGTGKYKDYHYIMIVGNIAIDGDTLK